jgi:hypothetical protein
MCEFAISCATGSMSTTTNHAAPVLFYAAILTIFLTGSADPVFQLMAWGYVGLRVAHTAVHITYNKVLHRFSAYFLSSLVLWAIWLRLTYILFG